ncbi:hypothetical protein J0910_30545 [Nocardiopsis sp. CNT-189]|uniref:hypothetical protein n=1 Tax=Nocardiopsis oceanisediminis TaxID=2816862 RepID=UPI003B39EA87
MSNSPLILPPTMSTEDVGAFYSVTARTVCDWGDRGLLPDPLRISQKARVYRTTDIWSHWQRLNPGTPHPGCALRSRHIIGVTHRVHFRIICRIADAGYLPTAVLPNGDVRIPETALPRLRDRLAQLYRDDRLDAFADQIGVRVEMAYYLLVRFGAAEVTGGRR